MSVDESIQRLRDHAAALRAQGGLVQRLLAAVADRMATLAERECRAARSRGR